MSKREVGPLPIETRSVSIRSTADAPGDCGNVGGVRAGAARRGSLANLLIQRVAARAGFVGFGLIRSLIRRRDWVVAHDPVRPTGRA